MDYLLEMIFVISDFEKNQNWQFYGDFLDDFYLDFRWYNFFQRWYSQVLWWIHLKLQYIKDYILEIIFAFSDFEENQNWRLYGDFSDDFCLNFRWYNFFQRWYSQMLWWIHLKLYYIMDYILEMICVFHILKKKSKLVILQ